MGLYSKTSAHIGNTYHYLTASQYAVPMTINVSDIYGSQISYWDSNKSEQYKKQWWITSFNPQRQNVQQYELNVKVTMDCSDNPQLYDAIQKTI